MPRKWTNEEIQFLKFAYPSKDFTINEIANELNRSRYAVMQRACNLKINRYKEKLPPNLKRCGRCKTLYEKHCFYSDISKKDGLTSVCKSCENERQKKRKLNDVEHKDAGGNIIKVKRCPKCNQVKEVSLFSKNRCRHDGLNSYCLSCSKIIKEESRIKKLKERGW